MNKDYLPRIFDEILDYALKSIGAVLVVGPKWCGKTTTCLKHAKTVIDMLPLETRNQAIQFAKNNPSKFLNQGKKPILIDEWQIISFIWNSIKIEVDKNKVFGQYILTGSVTDKTSLKETSNEEGIHTGNGRIIKKMMRTMSLYETMDSNGEVSLLDLQNNKFITSISNKTIDDYAFYICRGGWPLSINKKKKVALSLARNYYETLYQEDMFSLNDSDVRRNTALSEKFLRSYARNVGSQCSNQIIAKDLDIDIKTYEKFYSILERLFVIDEVSAWNPNLRSKAAIRTKITRYFIDSSIGAMALNITPESIYKDMHTFGFLFENLVIHDLKVYADRIQAKIYHYRDSKNREIDAVIVFQNGDFGLIEIKLGDDNDINLAANSLLNIQKDLVEKPKFMMVITKTRYAYLRDDGVYVCPLATLKF